MKATMKQRDMISTIGRPTECAMVRNPEMPRMHTP